MECLNVRSNKIFFKGCIKSESSTDIMRGVKRMDPYLGMEKVAVLITCTKKVMMGKCNDVCRFEIPVEAREGQST